MNPDNTNHTDDYRQKDFIIKIVHFLQSKHATYFFITSTDFHTLCEWWDKRIPIHIIYLSIDKVVERWTEKQKSITAFSNFNYEVKKNFKMFLQLHIGAEDSGEKNDPSNPPDPSREIDDFLANLPAELDELKNAFETACKNLKNNQPAGTGEIVHTLLALFQNDSELNFKTDFFLKNLSPTLRKPEIEERYRINYLIHKFHIPEQLTASP